MISLRPFAILLFVTSFSLLAENVTKDNSKVMELEGIEITGEKQNTPHEILRTEFPYHVSILELDPTKIQNLSLQDLLQEQVSLQINSFGGRANYSTLSIRGSSSSQVTVFIDGVEINRGDRQSVDLSTLDLQQFERIEIYRSHAPAKFGTGAIGGVVNLISKKSPKDKKGNLKVGVGSFGFFESRLNAFLKHQSTQHRLYASHEQAKGDFDYIDDNLNLRPGNPIDDKQKTRINNDYKAYRLGWIGDKTYNAQQQLHWNLNVFKRDKGLPGPAKFQANDVRYKEEHLNAQLTYQLQDSFRDSDSTQAHFSLQHFEDQYLDRNSNLGLGQQDFVYPTQTKTLGLQHRLQSYPLNHHFHVQYKNERQQSLDRLLNSYSNVNKRNKWDFGYDLDYFLLDDLLECSVSTSASLIQDQFRSNNSNDVNHQLWSWGLGLRYQVLPTLAFKSSLQKGLRVPTFSELFGDRGNSVGNQALKPERSLNIDLGMEFKKDKLGFLQQPQVEASLFRSERDDLIQMVFDTRGVGRAFNLGDGVIEGIEFNATTKLPLGFSLSQNYTYLKPTFLYSGKDRQIPGIYTKAWTPKLSWDKQHFKCSYAVTVEQNKYYDRANFTKAKDKELHHLNLAYTLKKIHLALDIHNLTDEQYEDYNSWPLAGRSFIISIFTQY